MTNAEKYLKDNVNVEELRDEFVKFYHNEIYVLELAFTKFFEAKDKPQLTEDERVILKNIRNDEFGKYIGRGDSSRENTPTCYNLYLRGADESKAYAIGTIYSHLFQFIKERRRILY